MRLTILFTFPLFFVGLFSGFCFAQQGPASEISIWFQEERFLMADRNEDAYLDRQEMTAFPNEFVYYLTDQNFGLTDQNGDRKLSFNEIHARRSTENIYRYHIERREIRRLSSEYPLLAQADAKFLRKHPDLVRQLFANLLWMYEHPELAEKIYSDKTWCQSHPEVLVALHRNLRWMAANPATAARLYQNRTATQYVPELMSWRADHKLFIRQHPKWKAFYGEGFIPGGIRTY